MVTSHSARTEAHGRIHVGAGASRMHRSPSLKANRARTGSGSSPAVLLGRSAALRDGRSAGREALPSPSFFFFFGGAWPPAPDGPAGEACAWRSRAWGGGGGPSSRQRRMLTRRSRGSGSRVFFSKE